MCIGGIFAASILVSPKKLRIFFRRSLLDSEWYSQISFTPWIETDASFRFERGADVNQTAYAVKRAAMMIVDLAGGEIASDLVDVYPKKIENASIEVKYKNIDRLIGKKIPHDEIFSILESLEIKIQDKTEKGFVVSVPSYRVDVLQEADIVEEILRIYGFNNIELSENVGTTI